MRQGNGSTERASVKMTAIKDEANFDNIHDYYRWSRRKDLEWTRFVKKERIRLGADSQ